MGSEVREGIKEKVTFNLMPEQMKGARSPEKKILSGEGSIAKS